uniref:Uncharacterized protein n=1 Tax=Anopheles atroparvus TaxID=41427 RepID=A0AAG5DFM9_ANOAO
MIPPPPPPLNRRPSYGYGCVMQQPVAPEPVHGEHQQAPLHDPNSSLGVNVGCARELDGLIGNGGYQGTMNQPDLFNFASSNGSSGGGTLKSTLKSGKPTANSKATAATPAAGASAKSKSKLNAEPLPVMMVDLMNGNATGPANGNDPAGLGGEPPKPYPPYYFDDNYLHHHYYYRNGDAGEPTELPIKDAMDAGQLYQLYHQHHHPHHHHPADTSGGAMYIPSYDGLGGLPVKYNTIGANGHLPPGAADLPLAGHFSSLAGSGPYQQQQHQGPLGHHASSCNVNQAYQAGSAKSNLIASHHFSNSLSNFNFNPSQYFGSALDPPPGTTIIPGGLGGVMGAGDGFPSSCSLNGTPSKQQPAHPWKHRQCPSRGSSSTGSGSS